MHNGALKKMALALTFWLAVYLAPLKAQIFLTTSSTTSPYKADSNGFLSAAGTFGGTETLSLTGSGTRMFFYPKLAAFRAGNVTGTNWNESNLGSYSSAFGYNTKASGQYSLAFGNATTASGSGALAFGYLTTATGDYSTASGYRTGAPGANSTASGNYTTAQGANSTASGYFSEALGDNSVAWGYASVAAGSSSMAWGVSSAASGSGSTAMGEMSIASGSNAIAGGYNSMAHGSASTAFGVFAEANGTISSAIGYGAKADAFCSLALGMYNLGGGNPTLWVPTDPILEIGNGVLVDDGDGASHIERSDAVVIYKNGDATFTGKVMAAPGGDIPMFTGDN